MASPAPQARRADSVRNRERLLRAGAAELAQSPSAPIAAIAARAGLNRGTFFRQAFRQHQPLDLELHQVGLGPTAEAEAAARDARILGRSYDLDFRDLVEDAKAALQSAALAEQSSGPDVPYLQNWAAEHGQRITARVHGELSNSQIAIFEAVGQILIKPEYR